MGQSPSSVRSEGSRRSFRMFVRRSKHNKSSLSHTFSLPPSEEYPELMNVNTATEEQLMTLPGVNRQLAREIVRHRQMIGRFKRVDDLALVSGIGAEKLELLRPEICTNTKKLISRASSCTYSLDSFRIPVENKLCSVNSSSVFQLQCVPGLNQEIAANIVDYRNKKGPFKSLDDLIKVRGIDIVRLSTVKAHLSLEPRKCESVQQLANGNGNLANGWSGSPKNSQSNESKTPKSPHRKSLSSPAKFPITLPNGFATAPVNDILDLLSAYSHRPIVEEVFMYERCGLRCCRIASWNLHQLNRDKITNPGVREVVCRTLLEYRITILAVQDVLDEEALKMICDELNAPALRRVKEYKSMSHSWQYCVLPGHMKNLGFIFETSNKHIFLEALSLEQLEEVTCRNVAPLVDALLDVSSDNMWIYPQAFIICDHVIVLVNVLCKVATLSEQDSDQLREIADAALECNIKLAFVGEFVRWENARPLDNCESLLGEEVITSVDAATTGRTAFLCAGQLGSSHFNGIAGVVRSGLCHLGIPRGWSWGGPASPFCPVYAELNVPD